MFLLIVYALVARVVLFLCSIAAAPGATGPGSVRRGLEKRGDGAGGIREDTHSPARQ